MIVLVCGSRDWADYQCVASVINHLPLGCKVIHGAARGADQIAGAVARGRGIPVEEFPADWRGKGRAAGIIRNLTMLDQKPDLVVAFQRNGSRGTQHTVDEARRRGIPVEVYTGLNVNGDRVAMNDRSPGPQGS